MKHFQGFQVFKVLEKTEKALMILAGEGSNCSTLESGLKDCFGVLKKDKTV